ncbi:hypothetical protein U1Q18_034557 [Sarracenia purpurea var. burkii]
MGCTYGIIGDLKRQTNMVRLNGKWDSWRRCSVQRKEEGAKQRQVFFEGAPVEISGFAGAWLLIGGDTNDPRGGERKACLPAVFGKEEDGFPAQHPGKNQRRNPVRKRKDFNAWKSF